MRRPQRRTPRRAIRPACAMKASSPSLDRGTYDPARAADIKRYEDQAGKQQGELDRLTQQAQKMGCQGGGFFALFSGQSAQCGPRRTTRFSRRAATSIASWARFSGCKATAPTARASAASILTALGQNDCGPQYRRYANQGPGNFFENLFGVQTTPSGADVPLVRHVSHALRPHLRRLLFPGFLFDGAEQVRRRRTAVSAHVPGDRGRALHPPQSGRGRHPRRIGHGRASTPSFPTPSLSQGVQQRLQLPDARARPGRTRCGSSTTRRSSAATSSCRPKSRPRRCRSRVSTRRASRSG